MKNLGLITAFVLATLLLAIGFQTAQLRRTVPVLEGTLTVAGLEVPVEILRDTYSIPHIFAEEESEAYFALGFAHAQDRMWQMEMSRRIVAGRTAEIAGKPALSIDRFMRTAGLYKSAAESLPHLSKRTQDNLVAYSNGVNAAIARSPREMGPEFRLLGITPEPWKPEDSLAAFKMLSLGLGGNMFGEISNIRLLTQLTPQQIAEFAPPYPGDEPILLPTFDEIYPDIRHPERTARLLQPMPQGTLEASNNWVVDGRHTATGKPLLSNDPHLGFSAPSIWYLAHISLREQNIVGGTMPGIPSVLAGRTNDISWGLTNTGPDTQDLYLERINPNNPNQYQTPDGWTDFEVREEEIKVRFGETEVLQVRSTRHGPVVPADLTEGLSFPPEGYVLALRWTSLAPGDTSLDTQTQTIDAKSWEEFNQAFQHHIGPMQNVVYADRSGTIGFVAPAKIPVRGPDHETMGLLPAAGWKEKNDWTGFLGFEDWPRYANPESGFIATANSKTTQKDYEHFITASWSEPHRTWQIENRLKVERVKDMDYFQAMHTDNTSLVALALLPHLMATPAKTEDELKILNILDGWDGNMRPDGPEGLVYSVWAHRLGRALYGDELGDLYDNYAKPRPTFLTSVLAEGSNLTHWCDRQQTKDKTETCEDVLSIALARAATQLVEDYGPDFELERWGKHHKVIHAHQPFSMLPFIGRYFEIETETGGGPFTPNQGMYRYISAKPFQNRHGAGYRAIYDMSEGATGRFIQTTGQSGNPYSEHFDDMAPLWENGELLPIVTDRAAIEAAATLKLLPKDH